MLQPTVDVSGLVYLKEKGKEAYASSAALTVPGHVTTHRLRTEGGKTHQQVCVRLLGCFSCIIIPRLQF